MQSRRRPLCPSHGASDTAPAVGEVTVTLHLTHTAAALAPTLPTLHATLPPPHPAINAPATARTPVRIHSSTTTAAGYGDDAPSQRTSGWNISSRSHASSIRQQAAAQRHNKRWNRCRHVAAPRFAPASGSPARLPARALPCHSFRLAFNLSVRRFTAPYQGSVPVQGSAFCGGTPSACPSLGLRRLPEPRWLTAGVRVGAVYVRLVVVREGSLVALRVLPCCASARDPVAFPRRTARFDQH
jgi:hypothetical protein